MSAVEASRDAGAVIWSAPIARSILAAVAALVTGADS